MFIFLGEHRSTNVINMNTAMAVTVKQSWRHECVTDERAKY